MAIYRNISISFWSDRKVLRKFSPEDKYFFLYLLTNESTALSGCYVLNIDDAACDLSYNIEAVENLLKRMEEYHNVIKTAKLDDTHYEVLVLNWNKYNWNGSPKQIQAVKYKVEEIHTEEFKQYILEKLGQKMPASKTVEKSQTKPPTCDEVKEYCNSMGYEFDWFGFWFHYDRCGWKDSDGNQIANWKKYLDACNKSGAFKQIG